MSQKELLSIQHRRAALAELCKLTMDRYLGMDGAPAQEQVLSEDSPYGDRFVSQDAWLEVLAMLQHLMLAEQSEAKQFKVVRGASVIELRAKALTQLKDGASDESEAAENDGDEDEAGESEGGDDGEEGGPLAS